MDPIEDDLHVVEFFVPHIIILQLWANDLSRLDPGLMVGTAIEDLVRSLHDSYNVYLVCTIIIACVKHFIAARTLHSMCVFEH